MPATNSVVAGTGFEGRAGIIRKYCRDGAPVRLVRELNNPRDPKAVAVYLSVPRLFGLLGTGWRKIGYVKVSKNKGLSEKMDKGAKATAMVRSFYAPPRKEHPRVSILISIE